MKKIIFFAYDLRIGGIETALVNLLNHLDYTKYDVTLALERKEGVFLDKINPLVHVKEYRVSNCRFTILRKGYNFIKRVIWSIKNKNKYDFSCLYATYSLPFSKLSKIASKNSSIFIHGDYTLMYEGDEFLSFFDRREIDKFRRIFFVSNESLENFSKYYPNLKNKFIVLNNFIDSDAVIELSKEKINLEKKHDNLFVFVGRLDEKSKRIFRMLEIIKNLKDDYSVELWVVGGGDDYNSYDNYIKDNGLDENVILIGAKTNPYPYMAKADFIILTSEYEGFPVVYLEAAALNKKVITTMDLSDGYINIKDDLGYIISKDVKKATDEIKEILNNDSLKYKKVDFKKMDIEKIKLFEEIIEEVR